MCRVDAVKECDARSICPSTLSMMRNDVDRERGMRIKVRVLRRVMLMMFMIVFVRCEVDTE